MRKLKLNFPYRHQQIASVIEYAVLLLGVLSVVVAIYLLKLTMEKTADWEGYETRLAQQQHKSTATTSRTTFRAAPAARVDQATQQELKQANVILQQLNQPWELLFDSLELAASKDVALLSLQPVAASRTVRLAGEAKNLAGLVMYVEALEREAAFRNVHLINYKIRQDHPQHPVSFLIAATWLDSL